MKDYDGHSKYEPLGAWSYFGLTILYAIPVIGWIFLIIFTFSGGNINRRSFTRSYWCWLILLLILTGSMFAVSHFTDSKIADTVLSGIMEKLPNNNPLSLISSIGKSYEEIYSSYSEKITSLTPSLIEELKSEGKGKDTDALAALANEKVNKLAEISIEGTQQMAMHMLSKTSTSDEYTDWATKLNNVYLEEAQKIMDVYMSLAAG